MKVVTINDVNNLGKYEELSLCLGFFDALHKGHLELINKAKEFDLPVGVLTFSKSPRTLLFNKDEEIINTLEMKEKILSDNKVDYLFILELSWDILKMDKEDFINKVLCGLNAKNIVCGFDYSFGSKGSGKPEDLIASNKFNVSIISPIVNQENVKISSTLVHELIKEGKIEEANEYLTRPYKILGEVKHGFKIGRTISYKTANIELSDLFNMPKNGVYATKVIINNKSYKSMTNVGVHPTINELEKPLIETYIFDFDGDIYLQNVELEFYKYVREERKFSSVTELKNQLLKDEKTILDYFK